MYYAFDGSREKYNKFIKFVKKYLAMEVWFHDTNDKSEVKNSRRYIGAVLKLMKVVFPRMEGNGWNIPKHHGMTKMQHYILLFGSGMNWAFCMVLEFVALHYFANGCISC